MFFLGKLHTQLLYISSSQISNGVIHESIVVQINKLIHEIFNKKIQLIWKIITKIIHIIHRYLKCYTLNNKTDLASVLLNFFVNWKQKLKKSTFSSAQKKQNTKTALDPNGKYLSQNRYIC